MEIIIVIAVLGIIVYFIFVKNKFPKNFYYWDKEASAVFMQNEKPIEIEKVKATANGFQTQNHGFFPWTSFGKNNNTYMFGDRESQTVSWGLNEGTIAGTIDGQSYAWIVETNPSYKGLCECLVAKTKLKKLPYWNTKVQFIYYKIENGDFKKTEMIGASYIEATDNCLFVDGHATDWEYLVGSIFIDKDYRYALLDDTIIKSLASNPDYPICMWSLKVYA